jgi:GrpB-like predicted nucleotidyltransferase (UPF0157 family)
VPAKPVIDMLVEVSSLGEVKRDVVSVLEADSQLWARLHFVEYLKEFPQKAGGTRG